MIAVVNIKCFTTTKWWWSRNREKFIWSGPHSDNDNDDDNEQSVKRKEKLYNYHGLFCFPSENNQTTKRDQVTIDDDDDEFSGSKHH